MFIDILRRRVAPLAALVVLSLLAAACGGSDDDTTAGVVGASATTAPAEPGPSGQEEGEQEPSDSQPSGQEEGPQPDDTAGNGATVGETVLSATDKGVTESVIRLGAVFPDITLIGRDPGDLEAKFQSIADQINEAGGINGRNIELYFRAANPLDDIEFEAVCVELTQDLEVFAVIGLFPRGTADCYGAVYDTPVISTFEITAEQLESYRATGLTTVANPSRLVDVRVGTLLDAGVLTEGSKVVLHGLEQARAAHEDYKVALEAAGIDVVADTVGVQTGQDLLALGSEMQVIAEVWQSSGADAVVASAALGAQPILVAYNQSGVELPIVLPEGTGVAPSLLQSEMGLDLSPFELATALIGGAPQAAKYEADIDGVTACVDAFEAASGEEVALDESRNNLAPTIVACQLFDIFTAIATGVGPELTRDSFASTAESFGPIEVTDLSQASIGPGKFDLDDSAGVVATFNPETVQFEVAQG